MQLTTYTDYSLRVLIYLMMKNESATISEIADYYEISRNHLVKVVHNLSKKGYLSSVRGKGGGIKLKHAPEKINIGDVVRDTEPNFFLVECFDKDKRHCAVEPVCKLKSVLAAASNQFLATLDGYQLADLVATKQEWKKIGFKFFTD